MNRMTILAVVGVFLAPVIIAVLLHSQWFDWQPGETRNHGELIEPPVALPAFELSDADNRTLNRNDLLDRWQLLHFVAGPCGDKCVETLYWLRQVRRAQDRHQPEVGLVLVTTGSLSANSHEAIEALETDIRIISGDAGREFARLLPNRGQSPISYILDPRANIMMRYPSESDFNGMRRDLSRLLTWTRTDQKPGIPDVSDP